MTGSDPTQDGTGLFSVRGRTALVTGGARGIGALIAQALVEAGATVYLTSRDAAAAEKTAARLSLLGECFPLTADLATEGGCRGLAEEFTGRAGRLHLLVHGARTLPPAPPAGSGDAGWDRALGVNLKAVFHLTRFLRPALEAAAGLGDPARVVTIGHTTEHTTEDTIADLDGSYGVASDPASDPASDLPSGVSSGAPPGAPPGVPSDETSYAHAASTAAVHHLTRQLAVRLGPRIAVNAVALGPFASYPPFAPELPLASDTVGRSPLRRAGGLDDLAGVIRFLGSRASAYLTGAVIPLDGGLAATR
ncbi:SDR family oxidoreductase [Streptomyces sp. NPDC089799]|uniref:SDR family oxidoreductase n=1 Tax=Streptomyces sp. NPDC089799 TaxID=3155066 RepID=UPI003442E7A1